MATKLTEPKIPNFFIVGAAKSGTTSLYHYLSEHPEIYLSSFKEPQFFSVPADKFPHRGPGDSKYDRRLIDNWEDYVDLFKGVQSEKVIGEASTTYLYYHKTAAPLIYELNSKAKILIIIRNPVDRAFSAYRHLFKEKRETLPFVKAIESEQVRMRENYVYLWFYKDLGYYYHQINTYLNTFGNDSVKICLSGDLNNKPIELIKDIFKYLGVDESFTPDISMIHNTSSINIYGPLNNFLNEYDNPFKKVLRPIFFNTIGRDNTDRLFHYVRDKISLRMKPETRKYLTDLYRDDILKLQDLIKRDLSAWM